MANNARCKDGAQTASVHADRGYPSAEREATLTAAGWRIQIQRKGSATKPISQAQKQRNRRIATPRARVEHVFGALRHMGGNLVRCMGIVRASFALHLKTASWQFIDKTQAYVKMAELLVNARSAVYRYLFQPNRG
ncbi:transposase [Massilia sp. CMS3.1]|uniref:transposase n=1 Tax=Massilia sp. CMS3.1 TaxID=3373083 RepID=UPI003EE54A80